MSGIQDVPFGLPVGEAFIPPMPIVDTESARESANQNMNDAGTTSLVNRELELILITQVAQQNQMLKGSILNKNKNKFSLIDDDNISYQDYRAMTRERRLEAQKLKIDELERDRLNEYLQAQALLINRQIYANDRWGRPII